MNIQTQDVSETRKTLVASLDAAEVAAAHDAVVVEITRQVQVPGFRRGKVPANVVRTRFKPQIDERFQQQVREKAFRQAIDETKIEVLNVVSFDEDKIDPAADATISITVDVRPEFELPAYEGIPVTKAPTEVTDEEVEKVIEGMRAERADFKVAERPSAKGDYVKLAYEGTVDGQPILEIAPDKQIYGKVPQTWEEVEGENEGILPGLNRQIAGVSTGDKLEAKIEFPAEFSAVPALAGKSAVYAVEVLEVRERVLPELDEEFCKAHRADDAEQLRGNVRNHLHMQKEAGQRSDQRRQVNEALLAKVSFEAPASLVDAETQGILRQMVDQQTRRGVTMEQLEAEKENLFKQAQEVATARVKTQFLLAAIAEKEEVKAEENEFHQALYQQAMQSGQTPDKFMKEIANDRERLRSVQQSIIFDKTLDLLVAKATVSNAAEA